MGKEPEIKGILKQRFEGMELAPDIDLWPAIEEKIQNGPKLWATWKPYLVIAACLAFLIAGWVFTRNQNAPKAPIAETNQKLEAPVAAENNYKQELAKLEGMRNPNPYANTQNPPQKKQQPKMIAYAPGPRSGQSLTLPLVEEQIIASKSLDKERQNNQPNTLKIKTMKAEKVEKAELVAISPPKEKLKPIELKPMEPSKTIAIQEVNNHKMEINLNKLTLKEAVVFAAGKLNEKTEDLDIPVKIEEKQTPFGKKKTYKVQLFNVSFSRTTYRPDKTTKQL